MHVYLPMNRLVFSSGAAVLLTTLAATAAPSTWEQWRGPTRDGKISVDFPAWPKDFAKAKQAWRVEIAEG